MAQASSIEWTDATWNPIVGCSVISPGCTHCYAMHMASRLARMGHPLYKGLTKRTKTGAVWSGVIRLASEKTLLAPLHWHKPRHIFVNSMSDLFHARVEDEWIDVCFAIAALTPQHILQVLTKRSDRMRHHLNRDDFAANMRSVLNDRGPGWGLSDQQIVAACVRISAGPLPNIWLGVSVEDQCRADQRIPDLLATPAAVRFLSCEPLLGPLDLTFIEAASAEARQYGVKLDVLKPPRGINWVICGGESGPDARPMHPDWARSLRDQCVAAGVPFFFKQWGEWLPGEANHGQFDPHLMHGYRRCDNHAYAWPSHRRVQNFGTHVDPWSGDLTARRIGKKAAGRLLDGRTWDEFPRVPA